MRAIQTKMRRRLGRRIRQQVKQTLTPKEQKKPQQRKPTSLLRVDDLFAFPLHPGQQAAWESEARYIAIIAGTQSGKTSFGPYWLLREVQRKGAGDYLAVAPMLTLLSKKLLPELKRLLVKRTNLFVYRRVDNIQFFELTGEGQIKLFGALQEEETRILIGHAGDPDALESMTAKAALLDECGQRKFKLASWEAIERRLLIHEGRVIMTTTPYNLGWLKQKIWDPWKAAPTCEPLSGTFVDSDGELRTYSFEQHDHDEIACIRFESIMNPMVQVSAVESQQRKLPKWKFDMFYRGLFTRPAGLIYDCFKEDDHAEPRFAIPASWTKRVVGIDFGPNNTAAVFLAHDSENDRFYLYRSYKAGSRSSEQHVQALLKIERGIKAWGGSRTEQGWRDAFRQAGLDVQKPPIAEVEAGIDNVYGLFQSDRLFVFDDLEDVLEELMTYSRELDDTDQPTDKIADKSKYHLLDALRYACAHLREETPAVPTARSKPVQRPMQNLFQQLRR